MERVEFWRPAQTVRSHRHAIYIEALILAMVLNRLCDPDSKPGVLRWLVTVTLPGVDIAAV